MWHKAQVTQASATRLQSIITKKILFVLSMILGSTFGRTMNSDGSWNDFSQLNQMLENVYEDIYGQYLPGITPAAYGK